MSSQRCIETFSANSEDSVVLSTQSGEKVLNELKKHESLDHKGAQLSVKGEIF